jgi:SAM-dependent methyltransferase
MPTSFASQPLPVESAVFYDAIAPGYADISEPRLPYLDGIDDLVVSKARAMQAKSYIDIGCGDGRRTLKIAAALGIAMPVGVDESRGMLNQSVELRTEHASVSALDLPERFDVITALWNVMGHVPDSLRATALANMTRHLRFGGSLMLDVNNRYNARAYGSGIVEANKKADQSGEYSGEVTAHHEVDGVTFATVGHVFHPNEIDRLVDGISGLRIRDKLFIDYSTGETVAWPDQGQVFYDIVRL